MDISQICAWQSCNTPALWLMLQKATYFLAAFGKEMSFFLKFSTSNPSRAGCTCISLMLPISISFMPLPHLRRSSHLLGRERSSGRFARLQHRLSISQPVAS